MAGGVNRVILIGNLGADPEVNFIPSGAAVANFRLAVNESWTDKNGQKQERVEWVRVVVWGKLGELCGQYLKKGRQCYVEGRLQTREWTDKEGQKQYTTEVVANAVTFLGGGKSSDAEERAESPAAGRESSRGGRAGGEAVFPPFGRSKGQPIQGASLSDLEWYAKALRRDLDDPSKAKWHDKSQHTLDIIELEMERQGGGQSSRGFGGGGGVDDDDLPF